MDDEEIDRLERLSEEGNKCRYIENCCTPVYNQCYNHSSVFCKTFERSHEAERERQRR